MRAGLPLHGANLFPERPAGLRDAVLDYIDAVTEVGHALLRGDLASRSVSTTTGSTATSPPTPTVLFRIFRYPPLLTADAVPTQWSVGEHTDYGLLTILRAGRRRADSKCAAATVGSRRRRSPTRSS